MPQSYNQDYLHNLCISLNHQCTVISPLNISFGSLTPESNSFTYEESPFAVLENFTVVFFLPVLKFPSRLA
jgi:hypothetical protein